jgi:uncharacterized protein (TIGR03083 family)
MTAMDVAEHIAILEDEGRRMAAAIGAGQPDAPVPSCPDWLMRDLVQHHGGVHRWATAFVAGAVASPKDVDFEALTTPAPTDGELVAWFEQGHAALVSTLRQAPPDVACWSFMAAPSPLAFWARRQAHETAIHRVDAELAAGRSPSDVTPAFGSDGVDEILTGFAPRRSATLKADPARTLVVCCDDTSAAWRLTIGPDQVAAAALEGSGQGDCVVRGGASHLYHALWNRRSHHGLSITGDKEVLDLFAGGTKVTWN